MVNFLRPPDLEIAGELLNNNIYFVLNHYNVLNNT